jgi:hypothetical protein
VDRVRHGETYERLPVACGCSNFARFRNLTVSNLSAESPDFAAACHIAADHSVPAGSYDTAHESANNDESANNHDS